MYLDKNVEEPARKRREITPGKKIQERNGAWQIAPRTSKGGVFARLRLVQRRRSLAETPPTSERRQSLRKTLPRAAGRSLGRRTDDREKAEPQSTCQKMAREDKDSAGSNKRGGTQQNWGGWVTNGQKQTKIDDK